MHDLVARTVDKWLQETHDKCVDAGLAATPVNILCLSVIPVAHTYCRAILDLINTQYQLPAMGLLRVLAELTLTTCWSLIEPDPDIKIRRWLKQSYVERKKLLKRTVEAHNIPEEDKDAFRKEIKEVTTLIKSIGERRAPNFWRRIDEIPHQAADNYKDMYRLLYSPFHRGIHPDLMVLGDTLREEGDELVSLGDLGTDHIAIHSLQEPCVHLVYQLVAHIRTCQRWDTQQLKDEYFAILKHLDCKDES